jgi:hypothetical protein
MKVSRQEKLRPELDEGKALPLAPVNVQSVEGTIFVTFASRRRTKRMMFSSCEENGGFRWLKENPVCAPEPAFASSEW